MQKTPLKLYDEHAELWVALSPPEDYAAEACYLMELIEEHFADRTPPTDRPLRILELGAGAGHTLVHFADSVSSETGSLELWALDQSAAMLEHAARLVPGVHTVEADMRDFRIDAVFDVVLLHDAADYLLTREDVRATIGSVRSHLVEGGLLLVAPTYVTENFEQGGAVDDEREAGPHVFSFVHQTASMTEGFELVLMCLTPGEGGEDLELFVDRHRCGLFDESFWEEAMTAAGFRVDLRPEEEMSWGLTFVGICA
jgi:SAM-dependent methyltransferase